MNESASLQLKQTRSVGRKEEKITNGGVSKKYTLEVSQSIRIYNLASNVRVTERKSSYHVKSKQKRAPTYAHTHTQQLQMINKIIGYVY